MWPMGLLFTNAFRKKVRAYHTCSAFTQHYYVCRELFVLKGIQIYSNEGPGFFPRGYNYEIGKMHWWHFKIFFARTARPILPKLGTKHTWVKGIQVCSNEEPRPCPRRDNYEIAKIYWWNLKIFFSKTTRPISTKLSIKHPWVKGIQISLNKGLDPFSRGDNYEIAIR